MSLILVPLWNYIINIYIYINAYTYVHVYMYKCVYVWQQTLYLYCPRLHWDCTSYALPYCSWLVKKIRNSCNPFRAPAEVLDWFPFQLLFSCPWFWAQETRRSSQELSDWFPAKFLFDVQWFWGQEAPRAPPKLWDWFPFECLFASNCFWAQEASRGPLF